MMAPPTTRRTLESLDADEERRLWEAAGAGDQAARSALIEAYLPFARIMAARAFARRTDQELEFDEYLQFGTVGLIEAVDRYQPGLACYKTLSGYRIHGAILSGLEHTSEKREQIAMRKRLQAERQESVVVPSGAKDDDLFQHLAHAAIGLALGFIMEQPEAFAHADAVELGNPYGATEIRQLRSKVRALIDRLPERERTVIKYHYLNQVLFADIAKDMNITRGRISQLHRRGLELLHEMIKTVDACDVAW